MEVGIALLLTMLSLGIGFCIGTLRYIKYSGFKIGNLDIEVGHDNIICLRGPSETKYFYDDKFHDDVRCD